VATGPRLFLRGHSIHHFAGCVRRCDSQFSQRHEAASVPLLKIPLVPITNTCQFEPGWWRPPHPLPDFYGPSVHVSTLQNALNEAASGKTVNWLGSADTQREYIYVPDAMRIAAAVGARTKAFGGHWCLPGDGPLSGRQAAEIAGRYLGRSVKLRSAGMMTLRIVSLFNKDLRGLLQVAPDYMKPVNYDTRKLLRLLGPQRMTSYADGIGETLTWISSSR
jgi:nucleoside-diphosphate-sugar epimerase